jgi:serine/threonine protein kinase
LQDSSFLYIITELAEGGELLHRLSERKTFSEEDAIKLVRNILEAIKYLHSLKIAHRDLKPENLLLKSKDDDTDVRLADFGISRFYDEGFMKTTCGTPAYTAPGSASF